MMLPRKGFTMKKGSHGNMRSKTPSKNSGKQGPHHDAGFSGLTEEKGGQPGQMEKPKHHNPYPKGLS